MKCIKCKKEIPEGSKFCNHCGAKQEKAKKKRTDGRIEKKITINGKRISFYAKTQKELNQKILDYKEELEKQRYNKPFVDVAEEWKEVHLPNLEYSTQKSYIPKIKRVKEYFGEMSISQLTCKDIMDYISLYPESWSQKTVNNYSSIVKMIFQFALKMGYIKSNPYEQVELPKGRKKTNRTAPTEEEVNIICNSIDEFCGFLPYFVLFTGLRRGEAMALQWKDIDFKKKLITVNKSVSWHSNTPYIKEPKTEKGKRKVVLLECLEKELLKRKGKKKDLVFSVDGELYKNSKLTRDFNKYKKATGLSDVTLHRLRHGYATMLEEVNVALKTRQELLGHANITTTLDVYTDVTEKQKEIARNEINDFISKGVVKVSSNNLVS